MGLTSTTMMYLTPEVTEFGEITQNSSRYLIQGHSSSPISVPVRSLCATSCVCIIVTCHLSCTVSNIWQTNGLVFSVDRILFFNALVLGKSLDLGL